MSVRSHRGASCFCALSALLCILILSLWGRSHWTSDCWLFTRWTDWGAAGVNGWWRARSVDLSSNAGVLVFGHEEYWAFDEGLTVGVGASRTWKSHWAADPDLSPPPVNSALLGKLGFWVKRTRSGGDGLLDWSRWELAVPHWALAAVSALAPILFGLRRFRGARLKRQGLCFRCGYDLRASNGRCPECGEPFNRGGEAIIKVTELTS